MKKEKYLYYGNVIAIILIIYSFSLLITVTITQKPLLSEIMPYTEILLLVNLFYVIYYAKK